MVYHIIPWVELTWSPPHFPAYVNGTVCSQLKAQFKLVKQMENMVNQ